MKCYTHTEIDAVGSCSNCGKMICDQCAVEVQGKLKCRDCLAVGTTATQREHDPNTAFVIELVGGFFGLLGLGYMYVGRTNDGIVRLIIWLIYDIIAGITIILLSSILIGLICIPFQLIIQIGVPIWSATTLKNDLLRSEN